ncbi:MAG: aminoglycoside phosphotransferase family protein [Brevefilum sp.]
MTSPKQNDLTLEKVRGVVETVLPKKKLIKVQNRGLWVRQIYELIFDGGERAFMKLHVHLEWLDSTKTEAMLCDLLHKHHLPSPETIFVDSTGEYLGFPFIIQSALPGKPMFSLLDEINTEDWPTLFSAVGNTYARMHAIKGPASGVWDGSLEKTRPISPNDYYFKYELQNGSGRSAVECGRISQSEFEKIITLWEEALPTLKSHEPSLVHGSAFPWTICLSQTGGLWQVSRLNALGDFLWWDPAYDQACLVFPPGYSWPEFCIEAFWDAYGAEPDAWRIQLYALMQHLCALNGTFLPPQLPSSALQLTDQEMVARLRRILALF